MSQNPESATEPKTNVRLKGMALRKGGMSTNQRCSPTGQRCGVSELLSFLRDPVTIERGLFRAPAWVFLQSRPEDSPTFRVRY